MRAAGAAGTAGAAQAAGTAGTAGVRAARTAGAVLEWLAVTWGRERRFGACDSCTNPDAGQGDAPAQRS
ncbi:hypothetical protein [Mycolicibacter minnesotensis]|uniref:hypothetical protein n=1 Tax=Mycolicibacter minnesotensis TaxID=1118379 RepID=UPI00138C35FA|nr:hypothetical protein [Mycolicibacter minnesotensis]BBY33435.1 hypothetical protein MMIN_14960 [Mycolicibacter minnesotensis]